MKELRIACLALIVAGALPTEATGSPYVWAYDDGPLLEPCSISIGDYIEIGGREGDGSHTCQSATLDDEYQAWRTDGCGGSRVCSFVIEGNDLSGTYRITDKDGSCLEMTVCN